MPFDPQTRIRIEPKRRPDRDGALPIDAKESRGSPVQLVPKSWDARHVATRGAFKPSAQPGCQSTAAFSDPRIRVWHWTQVDSHR
jgi:hypothetical protein